ncbi:tetratricopeptide repeat protein [Saccharopolyspora sp. NPDC047091]|uniref:tetratricopeptide repeat protein n=1 Tax=Saccharopolyspora sp. NPDC047091 TaxID=3155924 RepID=UPI0033ED2522
MSEQGGFTGSRQSDGPENTMSGSVDGVSLQAGEIGDIHFGSATAPLPHWIPRQLPRSPSHFVNRMKEFDILDRWSRERTDHNLIAAVTGSGGVGKTALGSWWLQRDDGRFPDGQLYVDLGGADPARALPASEVLGRFLRSLGVPSDRIPVELDERTALYRSITAERALGILLDNAFSAAQVRPLVPSSGSSTVLVTSRTRLTSLALDGARFLDLDPLREVESVRLLAETLGPERIRNEPDDAADLARLCSGFPLALVVVGARLGVRPRWPLRRAVEQLRDANRRFALLALDEETSMGAVFDAAYADLSSPAAELYRRAARLPVSEMSIPLLAHALDLDEDVVESALEELLDAHLVHEPEPDEYGYHDLLRAHACDIQERPGFGEHAVRRVVEWYLVALVEADSAVNPFRPRLGPGFADRGERNRFGSAEEALSWCEHERAHIIAVFDAADARGWDDHVWQLCEALWSFFLHRKHYAEWIGTHRRGIAAADRLGLRRVQVRLRCQLGFAYLDQRRFDLVNEVCAVALATAETADDVAGMSTSLEQLGKAARELGDTELAVSHFERALHLATKTGRTRSIAIQSRFLGGALVDAGRPADAIAHLQRSASLLREIDDRYGLARVLTELGRVHRLQEDLTTARGELREALSLLEDSASPSYRAEVLVELADCAELLRSPMDALALLREAAELYALVEHPRLQSVLAREAALRGRAH